MNQCQCGKFIENTTGRIKDYQRMMMEETDGTWREELREMLRNEKQWSKTLQSGHLKFCLGRADLIIKDLQEARKERIKKFEQDNPEFMETLRTYDKLRFG